MKKQKKVKNLIEELKLYKKYLISLKLISNTKDKGYQKVKQKTK